jgi:hypothetical protein
VTCPIVVDVCSWLWSITRASLGGNLASIPPRRLAWRVPGRSSHLADLLDADLVGRRLKDLLGGDLIVVAPEHDYGLAPGTSFLGTRHNHYQR